MIQRTIKASPVLTLRAAMLRGLAMGSTALVGVALPAAAHAQATRNVSTEAELRDAINAANGNTADQTFTIRLSAPITVTAPLPTLERPNLLQGTLDLNGFALSGTPSPLVSGRSRVAIVNTTGSVTSTVGTAIGMGANGSAFAFDVTNGGSIVGGTTAAINIGAANATISNTAGGTIRSTSGPAIRLSGDLTAFSNSTVVNAGTIRSADGAGIAFDNSPGINGKGTTAQATLLAGSTTGTINFNSGGTVSLDGAAANSAAAVVGAIDFRTSMNPWSGTLNLRSGTGTIDMSTVSDMTVLNKQGTGTWTLTGASASPAATISAGTSMGAGTGTPSAGVLVFDTTGLTGAINLQGATIRAIRAGAFGTGTINAFDPRIEYGATGTYANPIFLASRNPQGDPTVLAADANVAATLTGRIFQDTANNENGSAPVAQPLVIDGAGAITLTNVNNRWNGTTTINAGARLIGTGATISGGAIANNGTLVYDQAANTNSTVAQVISGAGTLTKTGAGTTTLTARNSYTGTTTIADGTLEVLGQGRTRNGRTFTAANQTIQSSSAVNLTGAGAVLAFSNANRLADGQAYVNNLSGVTGSRVTLAGANGDGDLYVTNTQNTVFGGTIERDGIDFLRLGYRSFTGATLTLTGANNALTDVEVTDASTLALAGAGSFNNAVVDIDEGNEDEAGSTLSIAGIDAADTSIRSLRGGGQVDLGAKTLRLANADGDNRPYEGVIRGTGGLAIDGGAQGLAGVNTYTGATTIAAGATLRLDGQDIYNEETEEFVFTPASIAASSGVQVDGTFEVGNNGPATTITSLTGAGSVLLSPPLSFSFGPLFAIAAANASGVEPTTLTISNASGTFAGVISDTTSYYDFEADEFREESTGSGVTIAGGTQVFTGANTYTGATTLDGGNLTLGDGGTTGSVAGPIALSGDNGAGTLTFNRSDADLTIAGVISGTGNLVQAGPGATTLTALNTYTGTTTIADGTLIVANDGGDGIFSSSAVALTGANAVLQFNSAYQGAVQNLSGVAGSRVTFAPDANGEAFDNSLSVTNSVDTVFGGTVTGAEAQEGRPFGVQIGKFGPGALTLTAANANVDYAFVGEGALRLAGDASLTNAVVFLAGSDGSLSFDVSGVTAPETSIVDLAGGEGSFVLLGAKTLRISDARGGYNGVIAGSGGLAIDGGPRLSLGGINTYTGATTIAAGATLGLTSTTTDRDPVTGQRSVVDGSIAASSGVQADGTFDAQYLAGDTTIRALTGAGTGQVLLGSTRFDETAQNFAVAPRTLIITSANGVFAGLISDAVFLPNNQTGVGSNVSSGSGVTIAGGTQVFTGANTYTGTTTLAGGNLALGDGGTSGSVAGPIALTNGTLTINRSNAVTLPGAISGTGNLVQVGTGTTTLTAANTYTGTTSINAGTLALAGNGSIANSAVAVAGGGTFSIAGRNGGTSVAGLSGAGQVALGANTLTLTSGGTFAGVANGTGGITVASGDQVFAGDNVYTGTTTLGGGNLTLGDGGTTGSVAGPIALGAGTLTINRSNAVTLPGVITGTGNLVQAGTGTTTLTAASTYTGTTSVNAGTLALAGNGSLTSDVIVASGAAFDVSGVTSGAVAVRGLTGSGNTALGANTLTLTAANDSYAGVVSGSGGVTVAGGRLVLTGANTYTGATTVASGAALALGNGGTTGSVAGPIVANGTVDLDRSGSYTLANVVSGTGTLNKLGAGTTTLTGSNGAGAQFTGVANVNAGTLSVGGVFGDTAGNTATVNVNNGGTLHGIGRIAGSVVVNAGGTVSAGNSPGTLTVAGNYTLNAGSNSIFELGSPDVVGGPNNDLINVGGNLTLGGTLTLVNSLDATMALASGDYRLFNYGGALAGSFAAINAGATDPADTNVDTGVAGQVNLNIRTAGQQVQYWDGTDTGAIRGPQGGAGTWNTTNTNWTGENTTADRAWRSGVGIFGTTGGTVRVEGAQAFQGLQFTVNGYQLTGPGSLTMTGDPFTTAAQSFVTVDAGVGATIAAALTGNGIGLVKYGAGNLTLTGANTYTGTTTIAAGTLTGTSTSIVGSNIVNNGTLAYAQSAGTVGQAITGTGNVTVSGASGGVVTFSGRNAMTGAAGSPAAFTSFGPGLTFTGTTTSVADTVALAGTAARLEVGVTGSLASSAGNAVVAGQPGATIINAGAIRATAAGGIGVLGTAVAGTTTITNANGATISGGLRGVDLSSIGNVSNTGTISGGTSTGVLLRVGGNVNNAGTGAISGGTNAVTFIAAGNLSNAGRITGALNGVAQNAGAALGLINTGTINGGTAGVAMNGGGTLTLSNAGGATIAGTQNNAIYTGTGAADIVNAGLMTGGNAAVYADGALTLNNTGTIRNTTGGNAQARSGVYSSAANAQITNSGLIDSQVAGGRAIKLDGGASSITNLSGGTLAGNGGGAAVLLAGAGYTLDLRAGSTVTGVIDARATTGTNTVTLAGTLTGGYIGGSGVDNVTLVDNASFTGVLDGGAGTDTVTLTGTGTGTVNVGNLVRFETVAKTGTGRFTLTGTDASSANFQVNQGILSVGGGSAINDGALVDVAAAGTLNLDGSEAIGALSGAGAVTLGANTLSVVGPQATTFAGVVSGAGGLTRAGTGTLTLSGANSYTGATTIDAGTLALGASNVLADATAVSVAGGGTLNLGAFNDTVGSLTLGGTLGGTGTLTAASYTLTGGTANANLGAGTLTQASGTSTLNGTSAATTVAINGGTLRLGAAERLADAAALAIGADGVLDLGAFVETVGTAAIAGRVDGTGTLNAASYTLTGGTANANLGAGTLTQASGTSTLNGTSGAGTVTVTGGTLVLGASNRLADTAAVGVANGAALNLGASNDTVGSLALGGSLNGTGTLSAASYTLTGGTANANLGAGTLTQASGTSTLNGTSAATTVAINGGTLRLGAAERLADAAALAIGADGVLDLGAFVETVGTAAIAGRVDGTGTLNAASYTLTGGTANANLGAGTLTQASGTSTLNGTSGAATVNVTGGTLVLGASDRLADTAAVGVVNGAALNLGAFNDTVGSLTLGGTLGGTGTLSAASYTLTGGTANANLGTGTLTQASGTSTLNGTSGAGTVNVTGGTLVLGASNRLADTAAVAVTNGATLNLGAFNDTVGSLALAGSLNGTGTLTAAGYTLAGGTANANLGAGSLTQASGTSVLNGTSAATTVAINGGTLRLGAAERLANASTVTLASGAAFDLAGFAETIGNIQGAGTVALGSGSLTFGGAGTDSAFAGAVTGSGDFVKAGTGTLALAGNAASTARLVASAGTIALSGANGGSARIAGGTLIGNGATAGNLALVSGTLSPGSAGTPIGTIQAGSLTATGGSYVADLAGASGGFANDLVRVTGAATLSGATIAPRAAGTTGDYRLTQTYAVLTAGAVSGTFANGTAFTAVGNNADLQYRLRYDLQPNAVLLEVRRQVDFAAGLDADATVNQRALAAALNGGAFTASDDFARTLNAIQALSPAQRQATLDLIGGEAASATTTLVGIAGDRFTDMIRQRMSTGAGAGAQALAGLGGSDSRLMRQASVLGDGASTLAGSGEGDRVAVWLQGHGADGTLQGQGGTATVQSYAAGVVGGIEAKLGAVTLGVGGMVDDLEAKLRARQSRSTGTLYQGGGYVAYDDGRFFGNAVGSYFKADVDTRRQVYVGSALAGQARGSTDSDGYTLGGAAGYRLGDEEGIRLAPQVAGRMVSVTRDAYTETGVGGLGLAVGREQRELFTATGEVRLSHKSTSASGTVEPWANVGIQRMWGDRDAFATNRLTGAPVGTGAFRINGAGLPEWAGLVGGGIEAKPTDRVTLGASAESTLSGRYKESRLSLRVRLGF